MKDGPIQQERYVVRLAVEYDGADAVGLIGVGFATVSAPIKGAAGVRDSSVIAGSDADVGGFGGRCERVSGFCGLRFRFGFFCGDEDAVELDDGGIGSRLPLEECTVTCGGRVQANDRRNNSSAGCNDGLGEASGATFGVEDADAVGEGGGGFGGESCGKLVGDGGRARGDGRATVVQVGFAEGLEADETAAVSRQISAVSGAGTFRPSVVREGVVQWKRTCSPTRWAVRSVGMSLR